MKTKLYLAILMSGLAALPLAAQTPAPPPTPDYQPLSGDELDQLLAPIALYPDPLLAEILPAATLPTQIVMADRYLSGGNDPNLADQQSWDPNVQALARYPTVLQWLDDNLPWTTEVGEAFVNQQQDVMDSIQRLRTQAYNYGNLQSTPQQQVVNNDGDIEILPASDNQIYLPDYQPAQIYYQSGCVITFGTPFPIGVWLHCDFDWHRHNLIFWDHTHPRPNNWWHELPLRRDTSLANHSGIWHPTQHAGPVTAIHGDRGWNNTAAHAPTPVVNRPHSIPPHTVTAAPPIRPERPASVPVIHGGSVSEMQRATPAPVVHNAPVEHNQPVRRPESTGAFIGIQSSHDTRTYSDRGQQSMQTVTHSEPAPAPRSAPAPSFGGGGGGGGGGHSKR